MTPAAYRQGYLGGMAKVALSEQTKTLLELGGLGLLAVPAGHHLLTDSKEPQSPAVGKAMSGLELAGLGVLAVPTLAHMLKR